MTPELFLLCILAAFLELDTTYAFQFTLSRGIVAGPLLSLVTGDLMAGIQVGVFTELLFCDESPLGGILPPSAVICSTVTLALHAMGGELYFAFFFGVVSALLFSLAEKSARKNRFKWLVFWEQKILQRPETVTRAIFIFVGAFGLFLGWLAPLIPQKAHLACKFAYLAVPWIGLATLVPTFRLKVK